MIGTILNMFQAAQVVVMACLPSNQRGRFQDREDEDLISRRSWKVSASHLPSLPGRS